VAASPAAAPARGTRLGLMVGIVSVPRPLELELSLKLAPSVSLSAQYSMLPDLTLPGGAAKLKLRAFQGVARWFPARGAFFLGAGLGYQQLAVSLDRTVEGGRLTVATDMSGLFVSPQLGWLWVWRSGLALGITIGAQIPIPSEPSVDVAYGGQPVPDQANATFSQQVVDSARDARTEVRSRARLASRYPLPNLDLLRIGFFF
jgi:hypothetical protein